jgi:hexokinase
VRKLRADFFYCTIVTGLSDLPMIGKGGIRLQKREKTGRSVLAVDIGGTKIIAALITSDGDVKKRVYAPTGAVTPV